MSLNSLFDSAARGHMNAVRITEDHRVFVAEVPVPTPAEDEVLIRPAACGLCGTDLHILHHGFPGSVYPVTPCHEFSGHIVAVGGAVRGLREGDFVAVDPNVTCGTCRWCRAGRPNLCPHLSPIGVARPGAAAEFVVAPARNTFRLRDSLRADVAAMIEPLACVLHAVDSSQGVKDRDVLVMGGGTMGLLIAIVCDMFGAGRVTIADPSPAKRAIAGRAGIANTIDPAALGEVHFDVVFEAAGVRRALEQAIDCVEKTGVLVQVGVHDADAMVGFNPFRIYERELRIIGSNSLADKFPAAVDVMNDIADRAAVLIGETFPAWEFARAAQAMAAGTGIKTQLAF
ncbi:alcohol dehydrogenase catalytic domain-containing protein [Ancylobacter lacus]|uniref:alcohol dehydrogenase catalytic domain-containing protein n=1 Tax=Ancylobacter lacus TaxID=2579970 RepID=UPI001BCCAF31|nr:alcohol dehydrogenase catalytic domain-containing protein [Ancylobacter lacus]MBS7538044.1 alcohol dehydrogenase catalytic domain-containing protein [Ancylobacter lacus]